VSRALAWDACVNARDLGGLRRDSRTTTRWGAVVRSDTVSSLTADGWASLQEYGVTSIVDLRSPDEVAADRPLRDSSDWLVEDDTAAVPAQRPVEVRHVPLLGTWTPELEEHIERVAGAERTPAGSTRAVYAEILSLFAENVAAAIAAIANAPDGGVLVHCQAGKDRTGVVCALLLLLADIDVGEIADDYALSGPNIAPVHQLWVDEAADAAERARRARIGLAPRQGMVDLIAEIDDRWGGAEAYLRSAGLASSALDAVRDRLL
jgi:protein-tyrosine phosphatase